MGEENFAGTGIWKLLSYESQVDDGSVTYPLGKDAVGQIMYDAKGNMSAQLADTHRPSFASSDVRKGTPEEIKAAFEGYTAYFGTYDVDEKKEIVTHRVKGNLFPNGAGGDNVRYYRFDENRLILSTPPIRFGGKSIVARLIWERIS
jgi:hypothetical protein